jgi:chromosome segregation ATPase
MSRKQPTPKPGNVVRPDPPPSPPKQTIAKRTRNKGPTIAALTSDNEKLTLEVASLQWEVNKLVAQLSYEQDTRDKQASSLEWYREELEELRDWKFNRSLWQRIKEVFVYG